MKKKVLFCGTPLFAVASLMSLFKHQNELNYILKGVVTNPDKVAGRGHKTQESEVKKAAKKLNMPIFTPKNLSDQEFLKQIETLDLDLIIVVAFKKLPKAFFKKPKIGTINLHASLLPNYRGAAPINWAIINGEKETGLTTFFINESIDTGDIILQSSIKIHHEWHANDLHDKLMQQSDNIIKQTMQYILSGCYKVKAQAKMQKKTTQYARKINKADFKTDGFFWETKTIKEIYNFIKGMSPPGLKMNIVIHEKSNKNINKNIIITRVGNYKKATTHNHQTQKIYMKIDKKNQIIITNGIAAFNIKHLKIEGGKELSAQDFYNGFLNKNIKSVSICK